MPRPLVGPNTLNAVARKAMAGPIQYIPLQQRNKQMLRPNPPKLTMAENRTHVLQLYRKIVRSVPRILMAYEITGGPLLEREAIHNIRVQFDRNRNISDPGVAAVLRHKCEMEVQESLLLWKTKSHVCNLVLNAPSTPIAQLMAKQQQEKNLPEKAVESPFLSSFYQG